MLDRSKVIEEVNKACKLFFTESSFILQKNGPNNFIAKGDNSSKAINNHHNSAEEVNVVKWFDQFWVYVDIRFEDKNTFISLSVFQGETSEIKKHQLFRAEWDDYADIVAKHPQPHWHITTNQVIENTFKELANSSSESETFIDMLEEEKLKIVDINKFHFAMNGNWANNGKHIHSLNNSNQIVEWFKGLLSHLKEQLEYVK